MAGIVAKSYCDAIFALACEENKLDLYREQLQLASDTICADAQFKEVMAHPKISKDEKKAMLETIYGKAMDHTLLNFLKLLVDKGRFHALQDIYHEFLKAYNVANNIQVVYVRSATQLRDEEVSELKQTLEKKLAKKIEFVFQIDKDLIAGIRIKINDQIIDNSASGRLQRLKSAVLNVSETIE